MVFIAQNPSGFRFRRSALFMPASNARAIEKARSLDCDVVIFDLEDAVGDSERSPAYENMRSLVKGRDFSPRETVIRVNDLSSPKFAGDMELALACAPDAILLPKVESGEPLAAAKQRLESADSSCSLWAMVETPMALMKLAEICSASPRLACLVVGPNDLARSTGARMKPGRSVMMPWLMQIVAAARANGLAVLDGVYNDFRNLEGLAEECRQSADMGFDGKTLIHPTQIAVANEAFGPSQADLDRARAIVSAFNKPENEGKGAIQIDGEMIERLHLQSARQLLALFERISE